MGDRVHGMRRKLKLLARSVPSSVRRRFALSLLPGVASVGVVLSADATAQTLPVPTPPPTLEAAPPLGGPAAEAVAPARPRPWEYATGFGVRWDSNLNFLTPDGPSGLATVPRGTLARAFWSPRGQLRAQTAGRFVGYADQSLRSRGYLDLNLDGTYRSSPATIWRASATYAFGHSDSSQPLVDQGVLLPLSKTRTLTSIAAMTRQLGTRTSLRLEGRLYRTDFEAPDLLDGESVRGTLGLDRRLGPRSSAALVYSLEDVLLGSAAGSFLTHFGSLQWTSTLSPRTALLLEAGASYTPDAARASLDRRESFFGGASLTGQVGRASLVAFVRREVVPAFGVGASRLEVRAGLTAAAAMGRDWRLRLASTHVRPDQPGGSAQAYPTTDELSVALLRRLLRRLEISGDVLYRRRGAAAALPSIEAFQAGVFVIFGSPPAGETETPTAR